MQQRTITITHTTDSSNDCLFNLSISHTKANSMSDFADDATAMLNASVVLFDEAIGINSIRDTRDEIIETFALILDKYIERSDPCQTQPE